MNKGSNADCVVFDREIYFLFVLIPVVYFAIFFPVSVLLGVSPSTTYYDFDIDNQNPVLMVLFANAIYVTLFLGLFFYFPRQLRVAKVSFHWVGLLVLFGASVYFNGPNFELGRNEIKERIDALSSISMSLVYCFLAGVVFVERNKAKILIAAAILIFNVVLSFERELLLYLAYPLIFRMSNLQINKLLVYMAFPFVAIFVGGYKSISQAIKLDGDPFSLFVEESFWREVTRTLLSDNLHKAGLEMSFFMGNSPEYSWFSYLRPIQIERILAPNVMTNGQMATTFYTENRVGTGYSIMLEAWMNFAFMAPFILPFVMCFGAVYIAKSRSPWLIMAYLVFALKIQRSDLWPAMISILGMPLLVYFAQMGFGVKLPKIRNDELALASKER